MLLPAPSVEIKPPQPFLEKPPTVKPEVATTLPTREIDSNVRIAQGISTALDTLAEQSPADLSAERSVVEALKVELDSLTEATKRALVQDKAGQERHSSREEQANEEVPHNHPDGKTKKTTRRPLPRHSHFDDLAHVPEEAERIVSENEYDCWTEAPIEDGVFSLRRVYKGDPDNVRKTLIDSGVPEEQIMNISPLTIFDKPVAGEVEVVYGLKLDQFRIPEDLKIGYFVNFDKVVQYTQAYEQIDTPSELVGTELHYFTDYAASILCRSIREIKKGKIEGNETLPNLVGDIYDIDYEGDDDYYNNLGRCNTLALIKAFPEYHSSSDLLTGVRTRIENLSDHSEAYKKILDELRSNCEHNLGENRIPLGLSLTPNPAIYYDNWYDSRFRDGVMPTDLVYGNIPQKDTKGDLDATALLQLKRNADTYLYPNYHHKGLEPASLFAPPNMTNLYMVGIPLMTGKILQAEKKLGVTLGRNDNSRYEGDRLVVVYCDTPQRLNPVNITKQLAGFGENGWILVRTDPQTSKLVRVVPKPKDQWKVTSRSRKQIPLFEDDTTNETEQV